MTIMEEDDDDNSANKNKYKKHFNRGKKNVTLFTEASKYGLNEQKIWTVNTENIISTVRYYGLYMPYTNMSDIEIADRDSDILVINLGLHYLFDA